MILIMLFAPKVLSESFWRQVSVIHLVFLTNHFWELLIFFVTKKIFFTFFTKKITLQIPGNAYYNNRYLDGGPNSASYLDSVRREDRDRRDRYNDPTLPGGRGAAGGGGAGDRGWGRDDNDKMDTASEDKK